MKKKLIAVAVASAISAPAMAQNVTVYGLIDAGYAGSTVNYGVNRTIKQDAVGGLHSANGTGSLSGSRLGVRGMEDLGGGMRAGFVYETAVIFSPGQAATSTPSRNDAVNLSANAPLFGNTRQAFLEFGVNSYGALRIGTQNTVAKDTTESIDPLSGVTLTGAASMYQAGLITRRDAIGYQSPVFDGLSARGQMYIAETTTGGATKVPSDNRGWAAALEYNKGPLRGMATMERITDQAYLGGASNRLVSLPSNHVLLPIDAGTNGYFEATTAPGTIRTVDATANIVQKVSFDAVGASYNLGFATVSALGTKLNFDGEPGSVGKISTLGFGLSVPMGNGVTLRGSYTTGRIEKASAKTYDLSGGQLVAQYDLSKRTHAYAGFGKTTYDGVDSNTAIRSAEISQYAIGVRHSF